MRLIDRLVRDRIFFLEEIPRSLERTPPHNVTPQSLHYEDKTPLSSSTPISISVTSPPCVSKIKLPPGTATRRYPMNQRNVLVNLVAMAICPLTRQLAVSIPNAYGNITQYEGAANRAKSSKSTRSVMSTRSTWFTASTVTARKYKHANQD